MPTLRPWLGFIVYHGWRNHWRSWQSSCNPKHRIIAAYHIETKAAIIIDTLLAKAGIPYFMEDGLLYQRQYKPPFHSSFINAELIQVSHSYLHSGVLHMEFILAPVLRCWWFHYFQYTWSFLRQYWTNGSSVYKKLLSVFILEIH